VNHIGSPLAGRLEQVASKAECDPPVSPRRACEGNSDNGWRQLMRHSGRQRYVAEQTMRV